MEFGVYIRLGRTFQGMLELAQYAEQLNYYGIFLNDHVHGFADNQREPYLESWTAMTGIGVQTNKIRLGQVVLFNSLRNPAFLAKSIATLDNMTNGRYELLIGAGWNEPEYLGYDLLGNGKGMPTSKERVERLIETLEILRGMLSQVEFTYEGKYWHLKHAINSPLPVQKQFRITVGGEKRKILRVTAKLADGLNIGGGLDSYKKKIDLFESEAIKFGKNRHDYYISAFDSIYIAKNSEMYDGLAKELASRTKQELEYIKKHALVGTPEILLEKLHLAQDLGIKMLIFAPKPATTVQEMKEKLEIIHDFILPALKS